jgi:hypothetical protein
MSGNKASMIRESHNKGLSSVSKWDKEEKEKPTKLHFSFPPPGMGKEEERAGTEVCFDCQLR